MIKMEKSRRMMGMVIVIIIEFLLLFVVCEDLVDFCKFKKNLYIDIVESC